MYVCVCVCVCACACMCVCVCVHACVYTYICVMLFIKNALMFQGKGKEWNNDEEQPPISNYGRFPEDKMGSMMSIGTPSAYSYPRIIDVHPPPASDTNVASLSKPPLPKRVTSVPVSTSTPEAPMPTPEVPIPTPVVTVPTLEVATPTENATLTVVEDTPASSAKGGMVPITFKQKKKERKEKKGKKAKHVIQTTTRYDSNPAYSSMSREQEGHQ